MVHRRMKTFLAFLLFSCIVMTICLCNWYGIHQFGKVVSLIVIFSYVCFLFNGRFLQKIILFFICYLIIGVAETTAVVIIDKILINNTEGIYNDSYGYVVIITQCFCYAMSFILFKVDEKIKSIDPPKSFYFLLVPVILTMIYSLVYIQDQNWILPENKTVLIILVFLFVFSLFSILLQIQIIKTVKFQKDLEVLKVKEQIISSKYEHLNRLYDNNFYLLHDLLQNCTSILSMFEMKDYNKIESKIHELYLSVFNQFNSIYTNSPIISMILNERKQELEELQITVSTTIQESRLLFLPPIQQYQFFNEIFDVAIDSSKKYEGARVIVLKSTKIVNGTILQFLFHSLPNQQEIEYYSQRLVHICTEYSVDENIQFDAMNSTINMIIKVSQF